MKKTIKITDLAGMIGEEQEPSSWMEITQDRVNAFADATGDHQFIHVDPEKAAKTLFRGTIAHGFLTLSVVPALLQENAPEIEGLAMGINYGTDHVRFVQAVKVGSRIRALQKIREVTPKGPRRWFTRTEVTVETEGQEKPALVAEFLAMLVVK